MKAKAAVIIVTIYLFVYVGLFAADSSVTVLSYMFLASPLLILWMVYTVLKDEYEYAELEDGQEWGYRDKARDELGMF